MITTADISGRDFIIKTLSIELLKFCKENDLPMDNVNELLERKELTDFQFGYLLACSKMWQALT